ncbi:MAG: VIT1/CCC1 transporter family protein [Chitinophagaceae bacterium]
MQSRNITSSVIIGLIDGIRSPLILAATMTFLHITQQRFQWVFAIYLMASAFILGLGHWFTLRSENKSATGEALQKEKEIHQNIGLGKQNDDTLQRKTEFVSNTISPALRVSFFFLAGGIFVYLPYLFLQPMEKALLVSLLISLPVLLFCAVAKARYYKVPAAMEIVRTMLLTVVAIGLIYAIIKFLA